MYRLSLIAGLKESSAAFTAGSSAALLAKPDSRTFFERPNKLHPVGVILVLSLMSYRTLQWIFPVLVGLHNAEEAMRMPKWKARGPWFGKARPIVFRFAVVALTVLAFALTGMSILAGPRSFWGNLVFGYMIAVLINAVVPHIAVSLWERTWMPGVITAVLNLPILGCLVVLALQQTYVSSHDALVFGISVPIALLLAIALLFKVGSLLRV